MYHLQYRDNTCAPDKAVWITWRECEEPADTNKHVLKADLKQLRKQYPESDFRYIKSIQITYSRDIVIE